MMRRGLRLGTAVLAFALLATIVPGSRGQFPLGMGFRGPGVPVSPPVMTPQGTAGAAYGGYSPYVGVFAGGGYGNGGYNAAAIASVPSAAYFTYGNTSYTTESPSPLPVYGGPRRAYAPLPPSMPLTALLKVQVPLEADVWLEGQKMRSGGRLRHYRSPPLDPAKGYIYEVRARWMFDDKPVEDVRHIAIRAGAIALVDFTHLDPLVPRPSQPAETPNAPKKASAPPPEQGQ
jgi:uncharacterized protein (TIGR03000 family)